MPNELLLPPNLHHLIEKCENGKGANKPMKAYPYITNNTNDEPIDKPAGVPEQDRQAALCTTATKQQVSSIAVNTNSPFV